MFQTNTRRRRPSSLEDPCPVLPDDVIEDILARLPAKAVHRCRCLSRTWSATLASGDFANLHLRLANRHGGPRILFVENWGSTYHCRPKVQVGSPDNPGRTTLMELPHIHDVGGRPTGNLLPRLVTQQCRGLFILQAGRTHYVLNPSTGRMAALPESPDKGDHRSRHLGLGYDTRTMTHKAVRVCCLPESVKYEVYEINSVPALWRPAKGCAPEKPPLDWVDNRYDLSVFEQGHVYWLARHKLDLSRKTCSSSSSTLTMRRLDPCRHCRHSSWIEDAFTIATT
ncbi:hypothetical protein CFC21_009410 [Triticum aestivum]|uniref:F-box domain-containing protein n=2 Tax=Triticum aestivum TaxID=4565 RepID=A0A3B5Z6H2_WHEAT|nr:probable F-box protein At1g53815 [Triticum aestivum]XP_044378647.1 probable F-box protein At1g53815 [Triticum aestivum]KAF6992418.1 hypothetical protein CFC21_009410 [Triticum aestivum]